MFRNMPFVLLTIILLIISFSSWISPYYQSALYGLSLTIKSFIVFVLPLVVFGLLFKIAVHFSSKASNIILFILAAICVSNFFSTLISFVIGQYVYNLDITMQFPSESDSLVPVWDFILPKWLPNNYAMFSGLMLGILLGRFSPKIANTIASQCERIVNILLQSILILIPLLVAGSVMKMDHDKIIGDILRNYGLIFLIIASAVFAYISFIYAAINRFRISPFFESIKNMFPAAIAGFGTMSSVAAMPLTILGVEKNSKNPDVAASVIPATVNIHLVGDCFAIPIFAFAVLRGFGVESPTIAEYLIFAMFFVIAKFSVASVPGGGILVMIPILEGYLGFDVQMISLITALYILFDPVITCANILGNGAFAMVIDRLASCLSKDKAKELRAQ